MVSNSEHMLMIKMAGSRELRLPKVSEVPKQTEHHGVMRFGLHKHSYKW